MDHKQKLEYVFIHPHQYEMQQSFHLNIAFRPKISVTRGKYSQQTMEKNIPNH